MRIALDQAQNAWLAGEVPVGAVIMLNGQVIATGVPICWPSEWVSGAWPPWAPPWQILQAMWRWLAVSWGLVKPLMVFWHRHFWRMFLPVQADLA